MAKNSSSQTLKAVRRQMNAPLQMNLKVGYARGMPNIEADPEKFLQSFKKEVLRRVRLNIKQSAFSMEAKKRLARAVRVKVRPNSILLFTLDPVWGYLVGGRRRKSMRWLLKAQSPIPIVTESGKVIFRTVTSRALANGKWVFPARKPVDLVSNVVKESRDVLKKRLARQLVLRLRQGTS